MRSALPLTEWSSAMTDHRRRLKQTESLQERLASFAKDLRGKAVNLAPGAEREDLLCRARQADTASHPDEWVNSPGLQPTTNGLSS